ncbi:hypothetical protein ACPV5G_18225 [Photobacterium damselae]|uniref:hypothetical protein n=1 Tax=Photobacterium damselae TaxID=38293 RepID=UPI004067C3E4
MSRAAAFTQAVILALAGGFFFTIGRQIVKFDTLSGLVFTHDAMVFWVCLSAIVLIAALITTLLLSKVASKERQQKPSRPLAFFVLVVLPISISQLTIAVSPNPHTVYERIALALSMIAFTTLPILIRHALPMRAH